MNKPLLLICILATFATIVTAQTPVVNAKKRTGTITIDGNPNESNWELTNQVTKVIVGTPNNTVRYGVQWDSLNLYVAVTVIDANKYNESTAPHDDDAVEIFIDAENNGGTTYGINDRQFIKEWNSSSLWEKNNRTTNIQHAWSNITNGYAIEMRIPWSTIGITNPAAGFRIGFDVAADDDDNGGTRDHQQVWAGDNDNWRYPRNFGDLVLAAPPSPTCSGTPAINFHRWNNILGTAVINLTTNAAYPNNPSVVGTLNSFEAPSNAGDNYGLKVFGYICPPTTGNYTFWIAGDDNVELWLSNSSNPSNKQRIAYHVLWTASREWNKYVTQKSAAIPLTAGQLYYVEALMKEGSQGDNMAVGWSKPGQGTVTPSEVIPGANLRTTIPDSVAPSVPTGLSATNVTQTSFTLSWNASTDNIGVAGYDVYRNGAKINPSLVAGTTYSVTGLSASTTYSFTVVAKDATGNSSAASAALSVTTLANPGTETFTQRTVIANQRMPHDLVYGPDNNIWYTERFAGTVSFVTPATGVKRVVLTLGSNMVRAGGQDGLMGLALHPQFREGKPFAYISYTYESTSSTVRKTRIARYTYDSVARTLGQPVTIIENLPGSNDHNSGRIAIGPDLKLYYTIGDMGAGQFDNTNRPNNVQNLNIYEGKVLRLNTEIISNSWIPADNPFTNTSGQKTAVYSLGHRNHQGLVWGNVDGANILYSSEHGPYSDDELNIIESGRNYGWPQVAGFCDGNYNGRTIGGFAVVSEQNNCTSLNAKEPLKSLFPAANPPNAGSDNMTWPSTAPSGMDFYGSNAIPGWQHSLLVAELKKGAVARFKLSNDGLNIISDTINYFIGKGRFRDVVVSPDGLKIYVACDSSGSTSGPTGGVTTSPANPGSILEFTYQPPQGLMTRNINQPRITENTADRTIDVYPNPARNFIIVYNYRSETGRSIELLDINGRLVRKQISSGLTTRIETNNISQGVYVLKVSDARGKILRLEKIVIQK